MYRVAGDAEVHFDAKQFNFFRTNYQFINNHNKDGLTKSSTTTSMDRTHDLPVTRTGKIEMSYKLVGS